MRISLRLKTSILIAVVAILLSTVSFFCYNKAMHAFVIDLYSERAVDLARTVAVSLDAESVKRLRDEVLVAYERADNRVSNDALGTPELDAYSAQFEYITEMDEYKALVEQIRDIQDKNSVEYVYLLWPDGKDNVAIYLADGSYEDQCLPGQFDYFTEYDHEVLTNPDGGFPPDDTKTVWGWLVAAGMPIYCEGEIVGYANADFSMDDIMAKINAFHATVIIAILLVTLVLTLIAIVLVHRLVVAPIQVLTDASMTVLSEGVDVGKPRFANVQIHTHDEIETLASAMVQMELEIKRYIESLKSTTRELAITRVRVDQMNEMASHDAMTKTFNKRAYEAEELLLDTQIANARQGEGPMPDFAIVMIDLNYLKYINDTYGHVKGDSAILGLVDLIRSVFVDYQVFRLGGDEFAIFLRNEQCAQAPRLIADIKKRMRAISQDASKEPWQQISAAVGFAEFDPLEDADTSAVLRRADKSMYEDKASMKAMRS